MNIMNHQTRSVRVNTMAEYVNNNIKIIGVGDNVGIDIPKTLMHIMLGHMW